VADRKRIVSGELYDEREPDNAVIQTLRNRLLSTLIELRPSCLEEFRNGIDPRVWALKLNLLDTKTGDACSWALSFAAENSRILSESTYPYSEAPFLLGYGSSGPLDNLQIQQSFTFDPLRESREEARRRILAALSERVEAELANVMSGYPETTDTPVMDFSTQAFEWTVRFQSLNIEVAEIAISPGQLRTVQQAIQRVLDILHIRRRPSHRSKR
jgi:hypothetical protein